MRSARIALGAHLCTAYYDVARELAGVTFIKRSLFIRIRAELLFALSL